MPDEGSGDHPHEILYELVRFLEGVPTYVFQAPDSQQGAPELELVGALRGIEQRAKACTYLRIRQLHVRACHSEIVTELAEGAVACLGRAASCASGCGEVTYRSIATAGTADAVPATSGAAPIPRRSTRAATSGS